MFDAIILSALIANIKMFFLESDSPLCDKIQIIHINTILSLCMRCILH